MKILQLCNKVPFPPKDGGCIAMNNLTHGLLNEGHEVKVLAINTPKHFVDIEKLPKEYLQKTNIEAVYVDTTVKTIDALVNLFTSKSYNVSRFYSLKFEQKIIEVLSKNNYDIIQLESLYVSMYIPVIRKCSKAKIVLRAHNVEHMIWERNTENETNPLKKKYLALLTKRLKAYELSIIPSVDGIAAITKEDEWWFLKHNLSIPVEVIPFGIELKKGFDKNVSSDPYSIFHIGAMDWSPNIEGVNWFLNNVWNKIYKQYPRLKFYLAGRNLGNEFNSWTDKNVVIEGEVDDASDFMRSKGLMIVPLLSGGGMRVKIIEGMAVGKVIVTTRIGSEGISYENNKNIIIANGPEEFIKAISRYISDPEFLKPIGTHAKELALKEYNNSHITKKLIEFYHSL